MKRALGLALLTLLAAAPASATEATIVPGVGIGKVKLGMTLKQVKNVLGAPQTVNKRNQLSGGRGYIEYGWDFTTFWVGFVNTKGVLHAALIGTDLRGQGTLRGVGIGDTRDVLRRKLPVTACAPRTHRPGSGGAYYRVPDTDTGFVDYCLFGPNDGRVTAFSIDAKDCHPAFTFANCTWYVKEARVTEPY